MAPVSWTLATEVRMVMHLRKALLASVTALALGFGASQALAGPPPATD
jgi:hypothetical protein